MFAGCRTERSFSPFRGRCAILSLILTAVHNKRKFVPTSTSRLDLRLHIISVMEGKAKATNPRRRWNWLLLLPLLLLVYPGLYARTSPVLLGFPFFYWYQFAVVLISALLTAIVYLAAKPAQDDTHDQD